MEKVETLNVGDKLMFLSLISFYRSVVKGVLKFAVSHEFVRETFKMGAIVNISEIKATLFPFYCQFITETCLIYIKNDCLYNLKR